MRQRLAIAAALLGDPDVLILDEPANGLDPPGIRWIRGLLREQAERGRAVLVSSHLLSEVAQSVDDVVVISHGTLRASGTLESVLGSAEGPVTRVRSEDDGKLAAALEGQGMSIARDPSGGLTVTGAQTDAVGRVANDERIALVELTPVSRSLEEAFFELTEGEKE
jgi:ABC-2 type transport system ATP-binding protein